jgi:hypothetical protein
MDDFDRQFEKTAKFARRWMIFVAIVIVAIMVFGVWAGYHIVMHFWG